MNVLIQPINKKFVIFLQAEATLYRPELKVENYADKPLEICNNLTTWQPIANIKQI